MTKIFIVVASRVSSSFFDAAKGETMATSLFGGHAPTSSNGGDREMVEPSFATDEPFEEYSSEEEIPPAPDTNWGWYFIPVVGVIVYALYYALTH